MNLQLAILYSVLLLSSISLLIYFPNDRVVEPFTSEIYINGAEGKGSINDLIPDLMMSYWHIRLSQILLVGALVLYANQGWQTWGRK